MGHIIHLPLSSAAIPNTVAALGAAERLMLMALRTWCADTRLSRDPLPHLLKTMARTNAPEAAFAVDHLMAVTTRTAAATVTIHPPHQDELAPEETSLLNAADLAQAGQAQLAERALRTTLLSAQDAACALVPLQVLGEAFAEASLFFHRTRALLAGLSQAGR